VQLVKSIIRTRLFVDSNKIIKPVVADWSKYLSTEQGSGLSSRNSLYLHSHEIFAVACDSYQGTKGQLKFYMAIAREKLGNFHGQDLVE